VEEGVISDIHDGTLYQSHPELDVPGNTSNCFNGWDQDFQIQQPTVVDDYDGYQ
jgi:hypothetical protein